MNLRFRLDAVQDAEDAADYLDRQQAGLGGLYLKALQQALDKIEQRPEQFPKLELLETDHELRRLAVGKFSYLVVYDNSRSIPEVISVMHTHRDASFLLDRLD